MRILFLTQILPYPPDAGPRIKTWNVLRYLVGSGHEVHLASLTRQPEEAHLQPLREICASVSTVPIGRSRPVDLLAWLRSHRTGKPFLVERDDVQAMTRLVREIMASRRIQAVHADQLTMAQFALAVRPSAAAEVRLVFDAHNAVWQVVERMGRRLPAVLGPLAVLEARRVKAYEGRVVRSFDRTLAVSEKDRQALAEAVAYSVNGNGAGLGNGTLLDRISVVPIGVDTQQLTPLHLPDSCPNVLTLGTLHYPPNADGVRWLAEEVFPLLRSQAPNAMLTVVGRNPPRDIRRLGRSGAVAVTGYVEDLTPQLEAATVLAVPVLAGGGMRVRILEGFARGMPMVTTSMGLEGIDAEPERDLLVADTAEGFADALARLLQDRELRQSLSSSGRRLVLEKYDWQVALEPLREIYAGAAVMTDAR